MRADRGGQGQAKRGTSTGALPAEGSVELSRLFLIPAPRDFSSRFREFPSSQLSTYTSGSSNTGVRTPEIKTPHPLENMLKPHRRDVTLMVVRTLLCVYKVGLCL